jgi:autotransporter strand-loop-strand O-heptosyltransferase
MENKFLNSEQTKNKYVESINNTKIVKREKLKRLFMNHNLIDGAFFEITGNVEGNFNVFFRDKKTNEIIHQSNLSCNMWTKTNRKYYTDWHVYLTDEKGEKIYETDLTLKNRRVYIAFDSSSIGDNIAWIPYVEEFRKQHNCEVIVSTFWNHLFEGVYTNLEFVKPGTVVPNIYAMYKIGCFYNPDLEPELCNTIPLQKVPCNILGLDYKEIKPNIDFIKNKVWPTTLTDKYVLIAPHSTARLKYWNNPTGWQEVVDYLKSEGYRVFNVSREGCDFVGVENISDYSMENIMKYISGCEFFIGLSSGLSWLAWSMNKHVFLISNFTNKEHEFNTNCTRIVNESVCNSCWVKPEHRFDKGDWNWCPLHKGTERQFECSKSITGNYVIQKIKNYVSEF